MSDVKHAYRPFTTRDGSMACADCHATPDDPIHRISEWRCFHCDTVFTNRKHAAEHFGCHEGDVPACKLSHSEGHLVTYIRKLQAELNSHREERDEILLAWEARDAEHREALRREEENGFARGVEDMKKHGYKVA